MASICEKCGMVGEAVKLVPGSTAVQIGLLVAGLLFLFGIGPVIGWPVLLGWLAYGIWRRVKTADACPSCKNSRTMISLESPGGKKLQKQFAAEG